MGVEQRNGPGPWPDALEPGRGEWGRAGTLPASCSAWADALGLFWAWREGAQMAGHRAAAPASEATEG